MHHKVQIYHYSKIEQHDKHVKIELFNEHNQGFV